MKIISGNLVQSLVGDPSRLQVIVQQVNAQGVMASGIAHEIREKYPKVWSDYSVEVEAYVTPYIASQHDFGSDRLGKVLITEVQPNLLVASIVGQQFYGREHGFKYTSYDALDHGLCTLSGLLMDLDAEIHHPRIGCGLGGGRWSIVKAIINEHLGPDTTLWNLETSYDS